MRCKSRDQSKKPLYSHTLLILSSSDKDFLLFAHLSKKGAGGHPLGLLPPPAVSAHCTAPAATQIPASAVCLLPSSPQTRRGAWAQQQRERERQKAQERKKKKTKIPPSGGTGKISTLLNTLEKCSASVQHTTKSVAPIGKLTPSHFALVFSKAECFKALSRLCTFFSFFHPRSIRNNQEKKDL